MRRINHTGRQTDGWMDREIILKADNRFWRSDPTTEEVFHFIVLEAGKIGNFKQIPPLFLIKFF